MRQLFYSDIEIISAIKDGTQDASNWFYKQARATFIKHVSIKMQTIPALAADEAYYSEELFHESFLRLNIKIYEDKLFVKEDTVYYVNKLGEETKLSGKLQNLLISIGDNILKEFVRSVGDGTFVRLDDFLRKKEADDENDGQEEEAPMIGINSNNRSSEDDEDDDYTDTPFVGIADTDEDDEDDRIGRLVRYIVANMTDPCKSIFKYTFFMENGKKMRDDEMAPLVSLNNADTVKAKRTQCKKKFKERFEELIKKI